MERVQYGEVYNADTFMNIAFIGKRGLNDFPSLNLLPPPSLASAGVACAPTVIDTDMEVQPTSVMGGGWGEKKVVYLPGEDRKDFNFHINQLLKK